MWASWKNSPHSPGSQDLLVRRADMSHACVHLDICAAPHQKMGVQSDPNVAGVTINKLRNFQEHRERGCAQIMEAGASVSLGISYSQRMSSLEVQGLWRFH